MSEPFLEQWRVPVLWWVAGAGLAVGAVAEVVGHADSWRGLSPYLLVPGLVLVALAWLSRQQVVVAEGLVQVPGARAPLSAFGPPEVLDREGLRQWRGPRAHRNAWVCVRPWLHGAVRLPVTDPEDDTPYWLIGSRRPERLAAALT